MQYNGQHKKWVVKPLFVLAIVLHVQVVKPLFVLAV
jgi:hypothetical protein